MEVIRGCLMVIVTFILMIIASTLFGAFLGWVVGWFFSEPILNFFAAFGVEGLSMWELGACLGFIGSFFKSIAISYPNVKQS